MPNRLSFFAWILCSAFILAVGTLYYPKWNKSQTEATISWDVSGYYFYLPAVFIYKDIQQVAFRDAIHEKYRPASAPYQAFQHPSGNFVMKYSCGLAVQYLPFFLAAHALAPALGYPADGFSRPYQAAIGWGSLLIALIGLWLLRKNLLRYFSGLHRFPGRACGAYPAHRGACGISPPALGRRLCFFSERTNNALAQTLPASRGRGADMRSGGKYATHILEGGKRPMVGL